MTYTNLIQLYIPHINCINRWKRYGKRWVCTTYRWYKTGCKHVTLSFPIGDKLKSWLSFGNSDCPHNGKSVICGKNENCICYPGIWWKSDAFLLFRSLFAIIKKIQNRRKEGEKVEDQNTRNSEGDTGCSACEGLWGVRRRRLCPGFDPGQSTGGLGYHDKRETGGSQAHFFADDWHGHEARDSHGAGWYAAARGDDLPDRRQVQRRETPRQRDIHPEPHGRSEAQRFHDQCDGL